MNKKKRDRGEERRRQFVFLSANVYKPVQIRIIRKCVSAPPSKKKTKKLKNVPFNNHN